MISARSGTTVVVFLVNGVITELSGEAEDRTGARARLIPDDFDSVRPNS